MKAMKDLIYDHHAMSRAHLFSLERLDADSLTTCSL